jgi:hypothetical protein
MHNNPIVMRAVDHQQALPIRAILLNPTKSLTLAGLIATAALLLGTILPALIAHSTRSFYLSEIQSTIKAKNLAPAVDHMAQISGLEHRLAELDIQIASAADTATRRADVDGLLSLRHFYSAQLADAKKAISIQPFYLNSMMFAWMNAYLSLGCIAFILSPNHEHHRISIRPPTIASILAFYVLYQCPVWFRNFVLNNEG